VDRLTRFDVAEQGDVAMVVVESTCCRPIRSSS
jgi:hypothetical protein